MREISRDKVKLKNKLPGEKGGGGGDREREREIQAGKRREDERGESEI